MYSYTYDPVSGGIILNSTPTVFSKEPRPVYAHEMDLLGFNQYWDYDRQNATPYMWAESNLQKCFYELNRLNRFINGVEDSQMRMILSLRYINGLTWQQIAFSIGEYDEQYPRRKHNTFLKNQLDENDERTMIK